MKIVAQMDEISSININTDSTFAILFEAQERGHEIFYYLPKELTLDSQKLFAPVKQIKLQRKPNDFYQILDNKKTDLTEFDVILVRQDPPFDMAYITSTYLLEKIANQVLILNNPTQIRNCPEKIFVTEFSDLTPKTIITSDLEEVKKFRQKHSQIILKPLYSCGGDGVFLIRENDCNLAAIFEIMMKQYQAPIIVQEFLENVKNGDKRILLLNGQIIGALLRVAADGEIRSNLHAGGSGHKAELSKRDLEICKIIGPKLKERGLFFVGIDVIGDYVTEINVTSPTCIQEINLLNNIKIEKQIVDEIISEVNNFNPNPSLELHQYLAKP
jgi:glutathione synthase